MTTEGNRPGRRINRINQKKDEVSEHRSGIYHVLTASEDVAGGWIAPLILLCWPLNEKGTSGVTVSQDILHLCVLSHVRLCDPMDCSLPGPSAMGFSRQEYCSGLPFLPAGDLPDPGIKLRSLVSPALAGGFFTTSTTKIYSQSPRGDLEQTKL